MQLLAEWESPGPFCQPFWGSVLPHLGALNHNRPSERMFPMTTFHVRYQIIADVSLSQDSVFNYSHHVTSSQ